MLLTDQQPVSQEDLIDDCEFHMREYLRSAKWMFENAKWWYDQLEATEEQKTELWFRFAAFERDLMKGDKGKKVWS